MRKLKAILQSCLSIQVSNYDVISCTQLVSGHQYYSNCDKTPARLPGAIRFLFGLSKMSTTMSDRASVFTNDTWQICAALDSGNCRASYFAMVRARLGK